MPSYRFDDGHNYGVSKLLVSLCVRDRYLEVGFAGPVKAHEAGALARCEPTRRLSCLLDEDLGPILVVASGERTRHIIRPKPAKPEPVTHFSVLGCVSL